MTHQHIIQNIEMTNNEQIMRGFMVSECYEQLITIYEKFDNTVIYDTLEGVTCTICYDICDLVYKCNKCVNVEICFCGSCTNELRNSRIKKCPYCRADGNIYNIVDYSKYYNKSLPAKEMVNIDVDYGNSVYNNVKRDEEIRRDRIYKNYDLLKMKDFYTTYRVFFISNVSKNQSKNKNTQYRYLVKDRPEIRGHKINEHVLDLFLKSLTPEQYPDIIKFNYFKNGKLKEIIPISYNTTSTLYHISCALNDSHMHASDIAKYKIYGII